MEVLSVVVVVTAAFFSGFIDSIVGGGGLIQVPALFSALPHTAPATVFGTNKVASMAGTTVAFMRYLPKITMPWRLMLAAVPLVAGGALLGAFVVTKLPADAMRPLIPIMLTAVAVYTFINKDFGTTHLPSRLSSLRLSLALLIIAAIGFYDGFFGPGTGSFFMFVFIKLFGFDFLHAAGCARFLNVATNLGAVALFASSGHVLWQLAGMMAVANVGGSWFGTRLALSRGSRFVRVVFLCVVAILIAKTAFDAWMKMR